MAASEGISLRNNAGEEQCVGYEDLIAVLADADKTALTVVYVERDEAHSTAPPRVKTARIPASASAAALLWSPDAPTTRDTHIIISTGSGTSLAATFFEETLSPLLPLLFLSTHSDFHIHRTKSETTILNLAKDVFFPLANDAKHLRIILLSGDGGIVDLVNGLSSKPPSPNYISPQVVLLPLGTANALYHSINAGRDNTWGLKALATDSVKPLPLFAASFSPGARLLVDEARSEEAITHNDQTGHPCLLGAVVCSWGMHASLVADSDTTEYRKFGVDRFKMAAKEALYLADGSPPHHYMAKVSILKADTWTDIESEEHMYVLTTMVSNLEKTFVISPASKSLDGSLHLVYFEPRDGNEVMRIMGLAYQKGLHVEDPAVLYQAVDGLRIHFGGRETDARWRRICIDGKIVRVEEDGWVELRKDPRRLVDIISP